MTATAATTTQSDLIWASYTEEERQMLILAGILAFCAHAGQYRRGPGKVPYIEHPIAVAARLKDPVDKAVALLHDTVEMDCAHAIPTWVLYDSGLPWEVIDGVMTLTRLHDESYEQFIERVATHRDGKWAHVKRADIWANLADRPTAKQRTRYEAALKVLLA